MTITSEAEARLAKIETTQGLLVAYKHNTLIQQLVFEMLNESGTMSKKIRSID
jgi:hypothetical protein